MRKYRAEIELLLSCTQPNNNLTNSDRDIEDLIRGPLDWPYLLRVASRHGLKQFLTHRLLPRYAHAIPSPAQEYMQGHWGYFQQQRRYLAEETQATVALLENNGIAAVPFLKTAMAQQVHGGEPLREYSELSLLVKPDAVERAAGLLQGRRYESTSGAVAGGALEKLRLRGKKYLRKAGTNYPLGLYWNVALPDSSFRIDAERMWRRVKSRQENERSIRLLTAEDLLLCTSVDCTLRNWLDLGDVFDVASLLAVTPQLNWDQLLEESRRARCERPVLIGLLLAQELFSRRLPIEVLRAIQEDASVRKQAQGITGRYLQDGPVNLPAWEGVFLQTKVRRGIRSKMRYVWNYLVTPSEADLDAVKLPARLYFLYGLIRPARLAGKFLAASAAGASLGRNHAIKQLGRYAPTPPEVVDRMLAMAEAGQDDVLYDLGCGDGRIVIEAARRFGTRGIGADLNPQRLADAKRNAQEAGVENRVRFLHTDATSLDLSEATIVTLYVAGSAALQLREKFEKELRPGARILANSCDVGEWEKCDVVIADGMPWTIYLWRVNLGIPFLSKWEARKA